MESVLVTYSLLGLSIGLWLYATGLYHDWRKGKDQKLGYRWKSPQVIAICVALALPIINIVFAIIIGIDFVTSKMTDDQ